MKLIFNKADGGQAEIKALLGFINADVKFTNLKTDVELNTVYLIQFIGQEMYDKLATFYEGDQTGEGNEALKDILKNAQLYVLLLAYMDYAANGDLTHGTTGRKQHEAEKEKAAWEWQIKADNGGLKRRAYKALDRLMELLDKSTYTEWTGSDQYKKANSLFLYNTAQMQTVFPINNSGQLYYRLVSFMEDVEAEIIKPILGAIKFDSLKAKVKGAPDAGEKELIRYCQKITAYRTLERASLLLPDEMLESETNYQLPEKDRDVIRQKRRDSFNKMADIYELELQRILANQNLETVDLDLTHGLQPGKKHVNL